MGKTFMSHEPAFFHYNKDISTSMQSAHFHSTYEVYYLISGRRRYFVKDRFYELKAGDIILIPPETVHKVQNSIDTTDNEYHERYLLCFTENILNPSLIKCFSQYYYHPDKNDSLFIKSIIEKMGNEIRNQDEFSLQMYNTYLTQILILLSRKYFSVQKTVQNQSKKIDSVIEEISKYIYINQHDRNLSLSDIANKYGYTKEYLSKTFKESVGCGFSELLTKTRLASSVELLTSTTLSIKQIAVQCGFKDSNYFNAVFKKKIGITPQSYREQVNSGSANEAADFFN